MKIPLSPQAKVFVAKVNDHYHVKLQMEGKIYFHYYPFQGLKDSVRIAYKILKVGRLDLQHWRKEEEGILNKDYQFLIDCNSKSKAHLWDGLDTFCRMWSTDGLGSSYDLFPTNWGRGICKMCLYKQKQT